MRNKAIVIVNAVRTPVGAFNGVFKEIAAHKLGEAVITELLHRTGIKGHEISEVILGQIMTANTGPNPARQAALGAGLPEEVPAYGINQLCGSGLRSICLGYQAIKSGDSEIVIAGGQENMTRSPHAFPMRDSSKNGEAKFVDTILHDALIDPFYNIHVVATAENIARKFGISREEQDAFSAISYNKCEEAHKAGKFIDEVVSISIGNNGSNSVIDRDEFPRCGVTKEQLSILKPALFRDSTITAGNSSGIGDGAAAVMLMTRPEAEKRGLEPMAEIKSWAETGVNPSLMGTGPVPASQKALAKAGWNVEDVDLIEANEAFASQAIYVNRMMKWDLSRVNLNGGAIALGHPFGASGARVLTTLLYEMKRQESKKALATLCIGGGMGIAMCLERVN
ncbi:MAG: acetyl-CoA C-acetyltransferase [Alphaproteobacteria bacterium]|nr:acetyl-CoA C-acetyltransferase [Alphaproteobacteria bacterium]